MAGKNKGSREARKPKQPIKAKPAEAGTDPSRIGRQARSPHTKPHTK